MTTVGKWASVSDTAKPAESGFPLPRIFCSRPSFWFPLLQTIDNTASHPATWDFLAAVVAATRPSLVVEAGTYRGHGALAMAESMRIERIEGRIETADVEDHGVMDVVTHAGLDRHVNFHHARFEEMLEGITQPIDLAFIDASEEENASLRIDYVNLVLPRMSPHGLVIVDDATDDGWPGAKVLRDACSLFLPTGRGLALFQAKA